MNEPVFNAEEVFSIALQMERNGQVFYARAAEGATDPQARTLFQELAHWEGEHEKAFAAMQAAFARDPGEILLLDPNAEETKYLQAFAEGRIFDLRSGPEDLLDACGNKLDMILRAAVSVEKESVVFYTAIRGVCRREGDRQSMAAIIEEEMRHVRFLSDILAGMKTQGQPRTN